MNTRYGSHIGAAGLLLLAGCVSETEKPGTTEEKTSAVVNGSVVTPWGPNPAPEWTKGILYAGGCGGTLVQPSWVLSAAHCAFGVGNVITSKRPSGNVTRTVDSVVNYPPSDVVMLHLSQPFTDIPTVPLYAGDAASVNGQTVSCYGYGFVDATLAPDGQQCDDWPGGPAMHPCAAGKACFKTTSDATGPTWCVTPQFDPGITTADLTTQASFLGPHFSDFPRNQSNQTTIAGDSGGPCTIGGAIVGVNSAYNFGLSGGVMGNAIAVRDAIVAPSRVKYTLGDFDGDGRTDFIATTSAGSKWYYSNGRGDFTMGYQENDLVINEVAFAVGNFDGIGGDDVAVTKYGIPASFGTTFYYSEGRGAWSKSPTNTALRFAAVQLTPGDFNGDGRTDLIVTLLSGSTVFYGAANRTFFTGSSSHPELTLLNTEFTKGNFDGNPTDDVIATTPSGSIIYYDGIDGTLQFSAPYWPRGQVRFTPGDFDGDQKTDFIVTTAGGSFWFYPDTRTSFTSATPRYDLPLHVATYTPGDFDGDGRTDLIITVPGGSFWYYSTGRGTWANPVVRSDLPRGAVAFTAGNFDGDVSGPGYPIQDAIITVPGGSFWYYSTGRGTFDAPATSPELAGLAR